MVKSYKYKLFIDLNNGYFPFSFLSCSGIKHFLLEMINKISVFEKKTEVRELHCFGTERIRCKLFINVISERFKIH